MGPKTINGSLELGKAIRERRIELGMTIEEAAKNAGVGVKTWCRYETGNSIREDKRTGLCRALMWRSIPGEEKGYKSDKKISEYRNSENWSDEIEKEFGEYSAVAFVIGSEILSDEIEEDLEKLEKKARGTHIGELMPSLIVDMLPRQFIPRYDYDFMYAMKVKLYSLCKRFKHGKLEAHSVLEEVLLYLIMEEAEILMESMDIDENWRDWIYDVCGDADMEMMLYSNYYVDKENIYHFDYWLKDQFGC